MRGLKWCNCCGTKILFMGYDTGGRIGYLMDKKNICYECAFWQNIIDYPPEHYEIVGSKCLKIMPLVKDKDRSMILGGKGKRRFFMRPDLTVFVSNDVWNIGTIPVHLRGQLPPTAFEITKRAYATLTKNPKRCIARGCFDRYHCARYKIELEDETGPFNKVPLSWKTGDERCRSFMNKQKIIIDDSNGNKNNLTHGTKNQ